MATVTQHDPDSYLSRSFYQTRIELADINAGLPVPICINNLVAGALRPGEIFEKASVYVVNEPTGLLQCNLRLEMTDAYGTLIVAQFGNLVGLGNNQIYTPTAVATTVPLQQISFPDAAELNAVFDTGTQLPTDCTGADIWIYVWTVQMPVPAILP